MQDFAPQRLPPLRAVEEAPLSYFGFKPVYDPVDLDTWIESRLSAKVGSTAERPEPPKRDRRRRAA